MKLQLKLAIYNALSKALILLVFGAVLPMIVERVVYNHTDSKLFARTEKVLKIIERGGINDISRESDCTFESFNILKEEFILIEPIQDPKEVKPAEIRTEDYIIEGETLRHRLIKQPFVYDNQIYLLTIGEGVEAVEHLKSTIAKFSLIATIILIFISVFIDIGFVRLMLKPFNKIIENKLTRTQDAVHFDVTPVKSTTYEFKNLDNSINEMMQRVKNAFLIEKEFITNVSHELQTPITILKSRFENMLVDENVPEEVALKIEESIKTLNRLSKIVKALLMISRIENEQYLKNETADVKEIIDEIFEDIHERLQDKNVLFSNNLKETHIISPANKSLIYTLLYNLIGNAIKYNVPNGTITLKNTSVNDKYAIEITDSGKGIAKENMPHIFERFRKFNNTEEPSYGLGLAIVKTIARFHNIEIQVESEEYKGTTFKLIFN